MALERRHARKQAHPGWGYYMLSLRENGKILGVVDATQTGDIGLVIPSRKALFDLLTRNGLCLAAS